MENRLVKILGLVTYFLGARGGRRADYIGV